MTEGVVLFGVGSPLVVDVEETLWRLGLRVAAAVRNVPGDIYLLDQSRVIEPADLAGELRRVPFLVPLFTPRHRRQAVDEARGLGFTHAARIADPTAILPRALEMGEGVYINAGCTLGAASRLGDFVLVNRGASLGHHAMLDSFVSLGPGVVLAGQVSIGSGSMVGAGAVVLPGIRIGENARVGAGAVVTRDVPD